MDEIKLGKFLQSPVEDLKSSVRNYMGRCLDSSLQNTLRGFFVGRLWDSLCVSLQGSLRIQLERALWFGSSNG